MKLDKIKPIVAEYANQTSLLCITPVQDNAKKYRFFFNFLFKKIIFCTKISSETYTLWEQHSNNIDFIIIHINVELLDEYKKLIRKIRSTNENIYILVLVNDEETKKEFDAFDCFCTDGLLPTPFNTDKLYKFFYRFLKKLVERKELEAYIEYLEKERVSEFFPETSKLQKAEDEEKISLKVKKDIRYTHNEKISAGEFVAELDDTIMDKVEDFLETLEDYFSILYGMQKMDSKEIISHMDYIKDTLRTFAYGIDSLATFPVIVRTFTDLVNFLDLLTPQQLDDKEKIYMLLEILNGLGNDLREWIINIFHQQNTDDIHYFDASFANNVLELEALFHQVSIESEEELDFEFF